MENLRTIRACTVLALAIAISLACALLLTSLVYSLLKFLLALASLHLHWILLSIISFIVLALAVSAILVYGFTYTRDLIQPDGLY